MRWVPFWFGAEFRVPKSSYVYRYAVSLESANILRIETQAKRALRDLKKRAVEPWTWSGMRTRFALVDRLVGFSANGMAFDPFTADELRALSVALDTALLIRAEAEQAKYDAEREAEKRGAA